MKYERWVQISIPVLEIPSGIGSETDFFLGTVTFADIYYSAFSRAAEKITKKGYILVSELPVLCAV